MRNPEFERLHPRDREGEWTDKLGRTALKGRGREALLRIERNAASRRGDGAAIVQIDAVREINERMTVAREHAKKVTPDDWDAGLERGLLASKAILRRGGGLEELRAASRRHGPKSGGGEVNDGFQTGLRFAALELEQIAKWPVSKHLRQNSPPSLQGRLDSYLDVLRQLRRTS